MLKCSVILFLWLLALMPVNLIGQQTQVAEVANTLAAQFSQKGRKVIAVSKFTNDDGFDDRFSRFLASQFTTHLALVASQASSSAFRVVDRAKTDAVLKELNLQYTKPFDANTFGRFGTGTGADTIITGDFRVTTNRVAVNCIAVNMSMEVVGGKVFDIPRTAEVDEYLGKQQNVAAVTDGVREDMMTPSGRANPTFKNGFIRADLISASRSADGQQLSIAVSIQNTLKEDLYLAVPMDNYGRVKTDIIDDQATDWKPQGIQGVQLTNYSGPGGYPRRELLKERCTMISPGGTITLIVRFAAPVKSNAKLYTFTAEGFRYDPKSPSHFSIGLRDFSPQ